MCSTGNESGGDQSTSTSTQNDVDSEVSFEDDADEEIDTTVIVEDWIEEIKRGTEDAMEKMAHAKIRCWNRTHIKMKWKRTLRISTSPSERWLRKAAELNPWLISRYWTNRASGRPRKRWEDDINNQTNKTWINMAKDCGRWALLEETYTMTVRKWRKLKLRQCHHRRIKRRWDDDFESSRSSATTFRFACINKMKQ